MLASTRQVVDALAGALGNGRDGDALAAACFGPTLVEGGSDVFDPLLLFRAVGEEQTNLVGSRVPPRRSPERRPFCRRSSHRAEKAAIRWQEIVQPVSEGNPSSRQGYMGVRTVDALGSKSCSEHGIRFTAGTVTIRRGIFCILISNRRPNSFRISPEKRPSVPRFSASAQS